MIDPKTGNYYKKWHITYRPWGKLDQIICTVYQNRKSVRTVVDALNKLRKDDPFIIILDIRMEEVR